MHCYILDMITYQRELIIFLHVCLRGGNMFHVCMNFTKALLSDQLLYIVDDKKKECMNHDGWCKSLITWWILLQTSNIWLKLTVYIHISIFSSKIFQLIYSLARYIFSFNTMYCMKRFFLFNHLNGNPIWISHKSLK